jgi:hypothetical protein
VVTPAYQPERLATAAHWGAGQSKVSKIERGQQLPSDEDLIAWATVTGAVGELDELTAMLRRLYDADWKSALHRHRVRPAGPHIRALVHRLVGRGEARHGGPVRGPRGCRSGRGRRHQG